MSLSLSLVVLGATVLVGLFVLHRHLTGALGPRPQPPELDAYPSVTVIRPVKGLDVGAPANVEAALAHGYPGEVQTLFVLDDESEPAVPLIRHAMAKHRAAGRPGQAEILFCGNPPAGRTGKLHAMIAGLQHARGELVAFADSDIRPAPGALTALVETLRSARDAGSAFAPVVSTLPPRTVGDAGYAFLLNALYSSFAAAATNREGGELPFIMGQFMILKRETIAAIGGLESTEGQLVDDMYIGTRVKAAGYRNLVSPRPVPVIQQGLTLGQFASIYRRWILFSRSGLDWSFKVTPALHAVSFWLGLLGAALATAKGYWLAAALTGLAPAAVAFSLYRLHLAVGGGRLSFSRLWTPLALLLSAPLVMLSIYFHRQVNWRGRVYQLDSHSRLAGGKPVAGDPAR